MSGIAELMAKVARIENHILGRDGNDALMSAEEKAKRDAEAAEAERVKAEARQERKARNRFKEAVSIRLNEIRPMPGNIRAICGLGCGFGKGEEKELNKIADALDAIVERLARLTKD